MLCTIIGGGGGTFGGKKLHVLNCLILKPKGIFENILCWTLLEIKKLNFFLGVFWGNGTWQKNNNIYLFHKRRFNHCKFNSEFNWKKSNYWQLTTKYTKDEWSMVA